MFKSLKNNNAGFSIVEIMIVLIVVGLVTTGVLLAAQTLQRNARNDARDRDVQLIAAAIQDYGQGNNGSLDGAETAVATTYQAGPPIVIGQFIDALNLTHYDSNNTNTKVNAVAATTGRFNDPTTANTAADTSYYIERAHGIAPANSDLITVGDILPDTDNVHIWVGYQCPTTQANIGTFNTPTTSTYTAPTTNIYESVTKRAFIIVYQHEGGGAPFRCVNFGS